MTSPLAPLQRGELFGLHLQINFANKHVAIVAHKAAQLAFDVLLKNKTWE